MPFLSGGNRQLITGSSAAEGAGTHRCRPAALPDPPHKGKRLFQCRATPRLLSCPGTRPPRTRRSPIPPGSRGHSRSARERGSLLPPEDSSGEGLGADSKGAAAFACRQPSLTFLSPARSRGSAHGEQSTQSTQSRRTALPRHPRGSGQDEPGRPLRSRLRPVPGAGSCSAPSSRSPAALRAQGARRRKGRKGTKGTKGLHCCGKSHWE